MRRLADSPYGHDVAPGMALEEAQSAVAATLLWHLRVLAGWLPPGAADLMRSLAAWFEIANVRSRLSSLAAGARGRLYQLGSLATTWPQLADAGSPAELAAAMARSAWGAPAGDQPSDIVLRMQVRWAIRLSETLPFASEWISGAALLFAARQLFLSDRRSTDPILCRLPGLRPGWQGATSIEALKAYAQGGSGASSTAFTNQPSCGSASLDGGIA